MEITLLAFGQIADIAARREWKIHGARNTNEVRRRLEEEFPELHSINYRMAVNKKMVSENVQLEEGSTVALMPPFSGG